MLHTFETLFSQIKLRDSMGRKVRETGRQKDSLTVRRTDRHNEEQTDIMKDRLKDRKKNRNINKELREINEEESLPPLVNHKKQKG